MFKSQLWFYLRLSDDSVVERSDLTALRYNSKETLFDQIPDDSYLGAIKAESLCVTTS